MRTYILLADGFEEVEALTTADILIRAGINVTLVKVPVKNDNETIKDYVTGSHRISIVPDLILNENVTPDQLMDGECIVLPGGMPGTRNLAESEECIRLIREYYKAGKTVAAICAAPSILGENGLLKDRNATCFPGFEDKLIGASVVGLPAVTDGNIVTGKSMGSAVTFGLKVVETLIGKEAAERIEASIYRG